jgi:hypothetical protein
MAAKQWKVFKSEQGTVYYAPDSQTMANYLGSVKFKERGPISIPDDKAVIPLRKNVYYGGETQPSK